MSETSRENETVSEGSGAKLSLEDKRVSERDWRCQGNCVIRESRVSKGLEDVNSNYCRCQGHYRCQRKLEGVRERQRVSGGATLGVRGH